MPKLFSLKKWYFDFVSEQEDTCYIYFIELYLGPFRQCVSSLHLYRNDRRRFFFQQKDRSVQLSNVEALGNEAVLYIDFPECCGMLHYRPAAAADLSHLNSNLIDRDFTGLRWFVPKPANHVHGELKLEFGVIKVIGKGYHDFVEIDILPSRLAIDRMYWGRVLANDWGAIFISLKKGSGKSVHLLVFWKKAQVYHIDDFFLEEYKGFLRLDFVVDGISAYLRLPKSMTLESGFAITEGREPNAALNLLYRFISGNPYERKFQTTGATVSNSEQSAGQAIFERVDWCHNGKTA
jgi:hypothetical protein